MSTNPPNVWQTASRARQQQPTHNPARPAPNRSGNASPSQQAVLSQPPRHVAAPSSQSPQPPSGVWGQRNAGSANHGIRGDGSTAGEHDPHIPVNGFNAADVRAFLSRDAGAGVYKPAEAPTAARESGSAWAGAKGNHMANGQPFFAALAKQIATLEGGG